MTNNTNIQQLLKISSSQVASSELVAEDGVNLLRQFGSAGAELLTMLRSKNGFYAFESALHVFPCDGTQMDIIEWNKPNLWKDKYGGEIINCLCFAEDIFGGQFCIVKDEVVYFEPETGELESIGRTIENWARLICEDYEMRTGHPLAHAWQSKHGALAIGQRLIAKLPFVLGGKYEVENLAALDALRGMLIRSQLAEQIKSKPDGTTIRFKIVE